jgi:hypothetical protein
MGVHMSRWRDFALLGCDKHGHDVGCDYEGNSAGRKRETIAMDQRIAIIT